MCPLDTLSDRLTETNTRLMIYHQACVHEDKSMTELKKFEYWPYTAIPPVLPVVKECLEKIRQNFITMNSIAHRKGEPDSAWEEYQTVAQEYLSKLHTYNIHVFDTPYRGIALFPIKVQKLIGGKLKTIDGWLVYKDSQDAATTYVSRKQLEKNRDLYACERPIPHDWANNTTGIYVV